MNSRDLTAALAITAALGLASCGAPKQAEQAKAEAPAAPAAAEPTAAAPTVVLPQVDMAAAEPRAAGLPVEALTFDAVGSTNGEGAVQGSTAPVYAVPVAAGQTLSVAFEPSNANLYFNVVDASDTSGAAVHRGEVDGANATITAAKAGTYLIMPFQPRAMARRNESATFKAVIERK